MRTVLVDDHRIFLESLATLLQASGSVEIVAMATTTASGVSACTTRCPDLLILDLALPDGSGLDVVGALVAVNPYAKTVVLSGQASSFVCPAPLVGHIHAVVDKTRAFSALQQEIARLFPSAQGSLRPRATTESLTRREAEVFKLIGRGMTNELIAAELGLSIRTIETHRKNLAKKLGTSGADLVRQAALFIPSPFRGNSTHDAGR